MGSGIGSGYGLAKRPGFIHRVAAMNINSQALDAVNRCVIEELERAGEELSPRTTHNWCGLFTEHVRRVEAAIVHTYQLVAHSAIRQESPAEAAKLWREMSTYCDFALQKLKGLKDQFPDCGTPELYDLVLDYKNAADERYYQNVHDSECLKTPPPDHLFPKTS
ncbi:MAG: hypothetical protein HY735_09360 [Verrucomicrobia bacterium]|nr:hypothetical protein [Verrucomicrobiota bacterium]